MRKSTEPTHPIERCSSVTTQDAEKRVALVLDLFYNGGMDYAAHYERLMSRGRQRGLSDCYFERHHVLPRCMGGSDHHSNIVRLTPEEHYVAHQLLVKMHPRNGKLVYAVRAMTLRAPTFGGKRSKNKLYGWIQRRFVALKKRERHSHPRRRYGRKDIERLTKMLQPVRA